MSRYDQRITIETEPDPRRAIGTESECAHEWVVAPGDWDLGSVPGAGEREEVVCTKCGVPGERYVESGEVHWPAT